METAFLDSKFFQQRRQLLLAQFVRAEWPSAPIHEKQIGLGIAQRQVRNGKSALLALDFTLPMVRDALSTDWRTRMMCFEKSTSLTRSPRVSDSVLE
jgi:hypothetical protein